MEYLCRKTLLYKYQSILNMKAIRYCLLIGIITLVSCKGKLEDKVAQSTSDYTPDQPSFSLELASDYLSTNLKYISGTI